MTAGDADPMAAQHPVPSLSLGPVRGHSYYLSHEQALCSLPGATKMSYSQIF